MLRRKTQNKMLPNSVGVHRLQSNTNDIKINLCGEIVPKKIVFKDKKLKF